VVAEGDDEPAGLLRLLERLLEPLVLRVVEVAAGPAALGDGVERDELEARPRPERVVGGDVVGGVEL
jgi:hypothetical protein